MRSLAKIRLQEEEHLLKEPVWADRQPPYMAGAECISWSCIENKTALRPVVFRIKQDLLWLHI